MATGIDSVCRRALPQRRRKLEDDVDQLISMREQTAERNERARMYNKYTYNQRNERAYLIHIHTYQRDKHARVYNKHT